MKKTILFLVIILGLFFTMGCSLLIDQIWNPEAAQFAISAKNSDYPGVANGTIRININRTDHQTRKVPSTAQQGNYFYGYYVYYNTVSPYEDYTLLGRESVFNGTLPTIAGNNNITVSYTFNQNSDATPDNIFTHTCQVGKTYYYRVAVVFRELYLKDNIWTWKDSVQDEAVSSWAAATCK